MPGFWAFIRDVRSILSWVVKFAALAPFVDLLVNLGPPWPDRAATALLTSAAAFVTFALAYEFLWHRRPSTDPWVVQLALVAGVLLLAGSGYMYFERFGRFVVDMPDAAHRVAVGTDMHPDVKAMAESDQSRWTREELLKHFEGRPEAVWTADSLGRVRTSLLFWWLLAWAAFLFVLSAFVSLQWANPAGPASRHGRRGADSAGERTVRQY
jgi:hypothetical protein